MCHPLITFITVWTQIRPDTSFETLMELLKEFFEKVDEQTKTKHEKLPSRQRVNQTLSMVHYT